MNSIYSMPVFLYVYQKYQFYNYNKDKKTIYLLGQGWLAKGFLDNIDRQKYYIINKDKMISQTGSLLMNNQKINSQLIMRFQKE